VDFENQVYREMTQTTSAHCDLLGKVITTRDNEPENRKALSILPNSTIVAFNDLVSQADSRREWIGFDACVNLVSCPDKSHSIANSLQRDQSAQIAD
jgi:hypothetical protein